MTLPMVPESGEYSVVLPLSIATRVDLGQSITELENLDGFIRDSALRQPGTPMELPKTSKRFEELVKESKLNMLNQSEREYLLESLKWMRTHAPLLHMSFKSEPSIVFTNKLIGWLRTNISPFILIKIGLHPNIGAGCAIRTTNKYYDFSLRRRFESKRGVLLEQLFGAASSTPTDSIVPGTVVKQ